jgi:hypothetical protein
MDPPRAAPRRKTGEEERSACYENVEIIKRPVPAPRAKAHSVQFTYENAKISNELKTSPLVSIREAPTPPKPNLNNSNIKSDSENEVPEPIVKTGAIKKELNNSATDPNDDSRSSSHSIKEASKMLKEAISDTLHENLKTAHQKIDKKWSSATKQIKNVKDRFSIGHFSLKKNQKPEETFKAYDGKNKSSSSVDPIFFNNISFNSPLSEKLNTPTT